VCNCTPQVGYDVGEPGIWGEKARGLGFKKKKNSSWPDTSAPDRSGRGLRTSVTEGKNFGLLGSGKKGRAGGGWAVDSSRTGWVVNLEKLN